MFYAMGPLIMKSGSELGIHPSIVKLVYENLLPPASNIFAANEKLCAPERSARFESGDEEFYGKILKFGAHSKSLLPSSFQDDGPADVVIFPGLGGAADKKRALSTYNDFANLLPDKKCVFYAPLGEKNEETREVRYARGMLYYANQHSVDEKESSKFYEEFLKPRLIDNGKVVPPESFPKLVMAGFSIGCRESESHLRYFENMLRQLGVSDIDCKKYTDRLARVNIASPRNWDYGVEQPNTLSFVSLSDFGSKKPIQFMRDFYLNAEFQLSGKVALVGRHNLGGDFQESLVVLPDEFVPCGSARNGKFYSNPLGHNLFEHAVAIGNNEQTREMFNSFALTFLDPKISEKEFKNERMSGFARNGGVMHEEKLSLPTNQDLMTCFRVATNYQDRENKAKIEAEKIQKSAENKVIASQSECGNTIRDNDKNFPDAKNDLGKIERPGRGL